MFLFVILIVINTKITILYCSKNFEAKKYTYNHFTKKH